MNFANPYYFAAILENIPHRFLLVLECESVLGNEGFSPPRFSVGAINATRDPRFSSIRELMEVGVSESALQIPATWLMVHQYIYIIHENTDQFGWQYRSQWTPYGPPGPKEEPWINHYTETSQVRRRVWMTTVVPRLDLVRSKRLLSENLCMEKGSIKLQGDLLKYEKVAIMKGSWQRRHVVLLQNRIEIFIGNKKTAEFNLQECEVKMLFEHQNPGGQNVFSIRNPSGTVSLLFDADDLATRRAWVLAIQYQLAMLSYDVNFPPLQYSPPTGEIPDNRVFICGDLKLVGINNDIYFRNFQLRPRTLEYYDGENLNGRIFIEQASVSGEDRSLNFSIMSASGICWNLSADNAEAKNMWILGIRRLVLAIDNYKMKKQTTPKEEQDDSGISIIDKISQYYDEAWTAPAVAGEDEDYLDNMFIATHQNLPGLLEFSKELDIAPKQRKPLQNTILSPVPEIQTADATTKVPRPPPIKVDFNAAESIVVPDLLEIKEFNPNRGANKGTPKGTPTNASKLTRPESSASLIPDPPTRPAQGISNSTAQKLLGTNTPSKPSLQPLISSKSFLGGMSTSKLMDPKRILINPRFMLSTLKGVTHRFVLVLECEARSDAPSSIIEKCPQRFSVGGPRASKDPRTLPLTQLIGISNKNPEVQLPAGWFMLHPYVYIIQQNTDDDGWQYRSTWSDGALASGDEQWVDSFSPEKSRVRRRMWMTTVVRKEDIIRTKKIVHEELNKPSGDAVMQDVLQMYCTDQSGSSWQRRKVILYHDKLEFYSGNDKTGDANLLDCEVRILSSDEFEGRDFPFRILHPNGSINIYLDTDSSQTRLRWVRAILYQMALVTPDLGFEPWIFGPPTGELPHTRIFLSGDLDVLVTGGSWILYQIQLQERALIFYSKDQIVGRLLLDQSTLKAREEENEFTLRLSTGLQVHLRAANADLKYSWVRAIKRQVLYLDLLRMRTKSGDEYYSISTRDKLADYYDEDWQSREGDIQQDDEFVASLKRAYDANLTLLWSADSGPVKEAMIVKAPSPTVVPAMDVTPSISSSSTSATSTNYVVNNTFVSNSTITNSFEQRSIKVSNMVFESESTQSSGLSSLMSKIAARDASQSLAQANNNILTVNNNSNGGIHALPLPPKISKEMNAVMDIDDIDDSVSDSTMGSNLGRDSKSLLYTGGRSTSEDSEQSSPSALLSKHAQQSQQQAVAVHQSAVSENTNVVVNNFYQETNTQSSVTVSNTVSSTVSSSTVSSSTVSNTSVRNVNINSNVRTLSAPFVPKSPLTQSGAASKFSSSSKDSMDSSTSGSSHNPGFKVLTPKKDSRDTIDSQNRPRQDSFSFPDNNNNNNNIGQSTKGISKLSSPSQDSMESKDSKVAFSKDRLKLMPLSEMTFDYLMIKGYASSEDTVAKIPIVHLREEDKEIVRESGIVDSAGDNAVIPLVSNRTKYGIAFALGDSSSSPSKYSISKAPSVKLKVVEKKEDSEFSPLQLVKLRKVENGGTPDSRAEPADPKISRLDSSEVISADPIQSLKDLQERKTQVSKRINQFEAASSAPNSPGLASRPGFAKSTTTAKISGLSAGETSSSATARPGFTKPPVPSTQASLRPGFGRTALTAPSASAAGENATLPRPGFKAPAPAPAQKPN